MYSPLRFAPHILWKRKPLQLTFFVTARCNAKCPFCFYLRGPTPPTPHGAELSPEEIEKLAPSLGPLLWILFSGGEPFLREDLEEISRILYKHCMPSLVTYTTNGLNPRAIAGRAQAILRSMKKTTVAVKVSMDGLEETHSTLRGVPGSFEMAVETCRRLCDLQASHPNLEVGVNTVFCSENQHEIERLGEFVRRRLPGVRTHTVSMVRGNLVHNRFKHVDLELYRNLPITMSAENKERTPFGMYRFRGARLKAAQDILQHRHIWKTIAEHRRIIPCFAGRSNVVLTETGEVYPCESFDRSMGNVRDSGLNMRCVFSSDQAAEAIRAIETGSCYCTHECYAMTNILFNWRLYPSLLRQYVNLLRT